jgi:predicted homoserine dehydrogenase-like protein
VITTVTSSFTPSPFGLNAAGAVTTSAGGPAAAEAAVTPAARATRALRSITCHPATVNGRLLRELDERASRGSPLRFALAGAGKFGTMLLAQARHVRGLEPSGVCDLDPDRAREALARAGWDPSTIPVSDELHELVGAADVVVEATGSPIAAVDHALTAIAAGCHVVMVTVEADALVGPALGRAADSAGVTYSLAYGDQPALVSELVDWARLAGFEVTCAGKGTKYLPGYHRSTPETVWKHYGISAEDAEAAGMNPRMFNSFLDGTKSAIEMAAVCNATGLEPPAAGLRFPPCSAAALAEVCIPSADGGVLDRPGTVEVVSSLERDGTPVDDDLRWGVFVTFAAPSAYAARCFAEYGLRTDRSGRYAALHRPYHLIGFETTVSVAAAGILGEPTGCPRFFHADVVATAKRDLATGEVLDGEGGSAVWGALAPAAASVSAGLLPIGLADGLRVLRPVAAGDRITREDVQEPPRSAALRLRRELERSLGSGSTAP